MDETTTRGGEPIICDQLRHLERGDPVQFSRPSAQTEAEKQLRNLLATRRIPSWEKHYFSDFRQLRSREDTV